MTVKNYYHLFLWSCNKYSSVGHGYGQDIPSRYTGRGILGIDTNTDFCICHQTHPYLSYLYPPSWWWVCHLKMVFKGLVRSSFSAKFQWTGTTTSCLLWKNLKDWTDETLTITHTVQCTQNKHPKRRYEKGATVTWQGRSQCDGFEGFRSPIHWAKQMNRKRQETWLYLWFCEDATCYRCGRDGKRLGRCLGKGLGCSDSGCARACDVRWKNDRWVVAGYVEQREMSWECFRSDLFANWVAATVRAKW